MKQYQKDLNSMPHLKATTACPVMPVIAGFDAPADRIVSLVYDNNFKYVGWTETETVKKFLLTKLYYKTKGAYSVRSADRHHSDRNLKDIYVKEKSTGKVAFVFRNRKLTALDIIDGDDKVERAKYALENEVNKITTQSYTPGSWSISTNDKFNLVQDIREEIETEIRQLIDCKRKKMQNVLLDIINADKLLKEASAECGIEMDI